MYICFFHLITKNTNTVTLGKLKSFKQKKMSSVYRMRKSPIIPSTNQVGREKSRMKRDIVFSHELMQLNIVINIVRVFRFPPQLPVRGVTLSHGDITQGSIEPDIQHLMFEFIVIDGNGNSPIEVTGDALGRGVFIFIQKRLATFFSLLIGK